jgi:peptide/nickel transport system substrate-binding protein
VSRSLPGIAALCALLVVYPCQAQTARSSADHGIVVIAANSDISTPVPTINDNGTNFEIVNLLFLRLAELGPTLTTVGERDFIPMLARSWRRRDSVTIVFDIDPRATWHDGNPVTAQDVVFTWERSRQAGDLNRALRRIQSVTADGPRRAVFHFTQPYAEQMYDATHQLLVVPSHLLASVPRDSIATSAFARNPVGNGAFRWVRHVPGQLIELAANDRFFLGRPKIDRVFFRVVPDADARLNLLLSGEADVVQFLTVPAETRARQEAQIQVTPVITLGITYALFNQRAYGDRGKPHPILSDPAVRRALLLALDRPTMAKSVYGGHATVPEGPVPQALSWVDIPGRKSVAADPARAQSLLAGAGWRDTDGDGVLEKNGMPLELTVNAPNRTPQRPLLAQQMQQRFREIGVKLNVQILEGSVWQERRNKGEFDIDMSSANLDPTPSGWNWSWSCEGAGQPGRNVGGYCNKQVDSLLEWAADAREPIPAYRRILSLIREDVPAIFLSAPSNVTGVHRRYRNIHLRAESPWLSLRRWSVIPGRQLPRDRAAD